MIITYIVTISPVIEYKYLNILIHSFNLQTDKNFNVIFYNQTLESKEQIFNYLDVKPHFKYKFLHNNLDIFFGKYPAWNLFGFHNYLIKNNLVGDYFISLHMEEFLEPDYNKNAIKILNNNNFDILFGNLYDTQISYNNIREIINKKNRLDFYNYIEFLNIHKSKKWGAPNRNPFLNKKLNQILQNVKKRKFLNRKKQLSAKNSGFTTLPDYILEDVYFMSKNFALRTGWFDIKEPPYFEDIHVNHRLKYALKKLIDFPIYFNSSKMYHLNHGKYYFQIVDEEFTNKLLDYNTNSKVLNSLKESITLYKKNKLTAKEALKRSRNMKDGSANLTSNYHLHQINKHLDK